MYLTPLMLIEKLNFAITQEEIKRKQVVAILLIPLNKIALIVISLLIQTRSTKNWFSIQD